MVVVASLKVTEVVNVVLNSQLYTSLHQLYGREKTGWLLITNTLAEVSVLVKALSVVRTGLPPLTSTPPMVTTGPAALQSETIMTNGIMDTVPYK